MKKKKMSFTTKVSLYFTLLMTVILALLGTWSFMNNVKNQSYSKGDSMSPFLHDYNWSHLDKTEQIFRYEDANYYSQFGIDVSTHQGKINWEKVKDSGVQFAMIRVGYRGYADGKVHEDNTFHYNIKEAIKHKIPVGVYFFSQAINEQEVKEEAQFLLERIRAYFISLPVVYDLEYVQQDSNRRIGLLTKEDMTRHAKLFMDTIRNNGYQAMIYSSTKVYGQMFELKEIQQYPVWVAEYDRTVRYPYQFQMWQYSQSGNIAGIGQPVDLNVWFVRK